MKKIIAFVLSLFCSVSVLLAKDFAAQVSAFSGKAEVLSGGNWKPLAVGDTLKNGDMVQTGFKSSLTLKIKDSTVDVAALTRMTVEQLAENPVKDNVRLFVDAGGVSSSVKKSGANKLVFTVRTPVATASVRGTEFSVQNNFDSVKVETTRGSVAVWNGKNSVSVADSSETEDEADSEENAETASFENAPHGALFVKRGQSTSVTSGGATSLRNEAAAAVYSMPDIAAAPVGTSSLIVNPSAADEASSSLVVVPSVSEPESSSLTVTVSTN